MSNNTALRKICYFNRGDNCTFASDYVEYMLTNTADCNGAFTFHFLHLIQVWSRPVNLTTISFPLECLMSISANQVLKPWCTNIEHRNVRNYECFIAWSFFKSANMCLWWFNIVWSGHNIHRRKGKFTGLDQTLMRWEKRKVKSSLQSSVLTLVPL